MTDSTTAPSTVAPGAPGTPPAPPALDRPAGRRIAFARLRDLALIPAIIVIAVVGQIISPIFLRPDNITNILQTMSPIALLVLGQTIVLVAGKMDLSLESTFGLAPGVAAWLVVEPGVAHGLGLLGGAWSVPIALLVGALVGVVNAMLIVRFGLNGFIVTLGMLIVLRGLLAGISHGQTFFNLPSSMIFLGSQAVFGVPVAIPVCLLLFAIGIVILGYTRFGRALYAVGGNVQAARAAGIRTDRVLTIALVAASVLAATGGLMLTGQLASVAANQGSGYIFQVFAAAVIGGISLNGGRGTVLGAFTGILLLFMIQNVLTLAGVPAEWIQALYGSVILIALVLSRITGGRAQD
ncbi:MAG TPA: ABC transporter permease [Catenuloplanes sp.]